MVKGCDLKLREVLAALGMQDAHKMRDEAFVRRLRANKTAYAAEFAARLRQDRNLAQYALEAFRTAVGQLLALT